MMRLPWQFKPMFSSEAVRDWFFMFKRLTLPVTLGLVCRLFRGVVYVVVKVVPSLVVVLLLPLPLESWPGGKFWVGMTFTGSDADTTERESLLRAMSLRLLYVVVKVVPSLVVLLLPLLRFWPGGISSEGMMYTGSDTEAMETESLLCTMSLRSLKVVITVVPSLDVVPPPSFGKG